MRNKQNKLIAAVSLCAGILVMAIGTAHAALIQTYHLSSSWSLNGDTFTWTGDVATDTGCTECTLTDLTSLTPTNQTLTSAEWRYDYYGQYFYQSNPGALASLSFSTTDSSSIAAWKFETGNFSWFIGNNAAICYSTFQHCYDGLEVLTTGSYAFTLKLSPNETNNAYNGVTSVSWTPQPVPLPPTLLLLTSGLLGLGAMCRRRKVQNA